MKYQTLFDYLDTNLAEIGMPGLPKVQAIEQEDQIESGEPEEVKEQTKEIKESTEEIKESTEEIKEPIEEVNESTE
jgi:hypothetical protein